MGVLRLTQHLKSLFNFRCLMQGGYSKFTVCKKTYLMVNYKLQRLLKLCNKPNFGADKFF